MRSLVENEREQRGELLELFVPLHRGVPNDGSVQQHREVDGTVADQ
jgi:hypothetical protein